VGIFPNEAAITRLVGAILLEQNDERAVQRSRYMTLETIAHIVDSPIIGLPAMADRSARHTPSSCWPPPATLSPGTRTKCGRLISFNLSQDLRSYTISRA